MEHQTDTLTTARTQRFERLAKLVSEPGVDKLANSHVMVVGLGGVGSWAAEALARSGVGRLSLVDFDVVSTTNFNRQMPATEKTIGLFKTEVMAERLRLINPDMRVEVISEQVRKEEIPNLFANREPVDHVIDAIDQLGNKCALIAKCHQMGIPIVVSTGAGGRLDPTKVRVVDLAKTRDDNLARKVRLYLRQRHGFSEKGPYGIPAVMSLEQPRMPLRLSHEREEDFEEFSEGVFRKRKIAMGTAAFVTSVFGMTCASIVVRNILGEPISELVH